MEEGQDLSGFPRIPLPAAQKMDRGGQSRSWEPSGEGTQRAVRVEDGGAWDGVVTVGVREVVRLGHALKVESSRYLLMD